MTYRGITLYGTVDIGIAYQTKGVPLSGDFYPGLEYLISKNANRSVFSLAPSGLSQSKLGVKGNEEINSDLSAVFRLETAFNPQSGTIADAGKSLVNNANVPLANQTANADGSRKGQPFSGGAYVGISSKTVGTLTLGRQNGVMLDDIIAYDPMGASYAFSPIGYSGVAAGGGDTEDARLDNTAKWVLDKGPLHAAALYQFSGNAGDLGRAYEFDLGGRYAGFSVDALFNHVQDALALAPLSTTQTVAAGYPTGSLAGTLSDNTSYAVNGKYNYGPVTAYAGWEEINYANPSRIPSGGATVAGFQTITDAGYQVAITSTSAYNIHKVLDIYWLGAKYKLTPALELTGAWYHYDQNSYKGNGCNDTSFSSCSGSLNAYSFLADYRFTKRFDVYAGAMYSEVARGLANSYLSTNTFDPMVGARFNF